ncbi:hypothetical protein [Natronorarus salvus]|uniref:hypothetical protein n=1 Tax=Natronorarus salvus TaxID=3117733 RepID=UPI002F264A60
MAIEIRGPSESEWTEVDLSETDTDENDEWAVNGTVVYRSQQIIEDWESYSSTSDVEQFWSTEGSGSFSLESGGLVDGSTQHIRQQGMHQMRSFPSGGNHSQTLGRYFEEGDEVEIPIWMAAVGGPHYNILANLASDTAEENTENWRFEIQTGSGLRIVWHDGNSRDVRASENSSSPYSTSEVYRLRIGVSSSQVTFAMDEADGTTIANISTSNVSGSEVASEMSIGQIARGGGDWEVDTWSVL